MKIEISKPFKGHKLDPPPAYAYTNPAELLQYYKVMAYYRRFEIVADTMYKQRLIRGFCHLYDGQEAIVTGMDAALQRTDSVITAYRDHCHQLSRGDSGESVMSELMVSALRGRDLQQAGVRFFFAQHGFSSFLLFLSVFVCSVRRRVRSPVALAARVVPCTCTSRRGNSTYETHSNTTPQPMQKRSTSFGARQGACVRHRFLTPLLICSFLFVSHLAQGGNGIVGAQIPLGAGLAFAHKFRKDGGVAVAAMGDGASNQGQVRSRAHAATLRCLCRSLFFVCFVFACRFLSFSLRRYPSMC